MINTVCFCLICGLLSQSTALVMSRRSVNLTIPWASLDLGIIYYSKFDRDHFLSINIYIVNVQMMAEFALRILHIVLISNSYTLQQYS